MNTSKSSTFDSETLTRKVYTTIHQEVEFFLISTVVDGVHAICVVNANQAWTMLERFLNYWLNWQKALLYLNR